MYQLPPIPPKKTARPRYRGSIETRELGRLAFEEACRKHPSVDPRYISPRKYRDDSANGLTRCVIDWIRLNGGQAERINCAGRYVDNTQVFTDVVGRTRSIGTGQWIPTSGQKGTADISAVIKGRAVKIEIKMKDRQSEDQKRYQEAIERAGGIYIIVHSLHEFVEFYKSL